MARAIMKLTYMDENTKLETTRDFNCDYFKDTQSLSTINQKLLLNNQQAEILVYVSGLNFEQGIKNTKPFMEINKKKYRVMSIEPVSGYGLSLTTFSGNQT